MGKPDFNHVVRWSLLAVSAVLIAGIGVLLWQGSRVQYLTLAAGASGGESYIISTALRNVVERHYPRIRIRLLETGGTVENLAMLERGTAQLAAAQADVAAGPHARAVAVLYDDAFQLLVPASSPTQKVGTCALTRPGVRSPHIHSQLKPP